jgi:multiple antibiotic resistance protein
MGITVPDFKIAGGILLLILSVNLLLPGDQSRKHHYTDAGIFPIGTPLITGPAVLTTTLVLTDTLGWFPTFISLIINMLITWAVLRKSEVLTKIIGINGMRAFSKVADILLTAIAVMMIRNGVIEIYRVYFR